jgi:protein TonB
VENNQPKGLPEVIEPKKEKESQKPVLPPPQTPEFIEAQLIIENDQNSTSVNDNLTTSTVPEKQIPPKEVKIVEKEPVYFVAVEEMPEPIGGISGIQKKIVYPEIAKRAGVEGKVLVLAFVDESGNVTKAEVIKGIGLGCDEAAINAIVQTKFKPGMQRGKPVKVQVTIPVTFKL